MKRLFSLIPVAVIGLTGCTGSTDPATANIFDNISNLSSGEYDRQIDSRRAQADAIIANNNASRTNIARMESQRRTNDATISALRGQAAQLRSQIDAARARNPAASAQLDALSSQVSAVQSDLSGGGDPGIASAELNRIRAAVRALSA